MVGAKGLGSIVYQGIQQNDIAKGFESGLGIVILAIILDRTTQAKK
jgi:glycine betaine/proline transport system permease protein